VLRRVDTVLGHYPAMRDVADARRAISRRIVCGCGVRLANVRGASVLLEPLVECGGSTETDGAGGGLLAGGDGLAEGGADGSLLDGGDGGAARTMRAQECPGDACGRPRFCCPIEIGR